MRCCSATARSIASPLSETNPDYDNNEAKAFGFYIQKGLFEEYAEFRPRPWPRPCALRPLS